MNILPNEIVKIILKKKWFNFRKEWLEENLNFPEPNSSFVAVKNYRFSWNCFGYSSEYGISWKFCL